MADELSAYERERQANVERNQRVLASLGLGQGSSHLIAKKKKKKKKKKQEKKTYQRTRFSSRERKYRLHQSFAGLDSSTSSAEPFYRYKKDDDDDDDDDDASDVVDDLLPTSSGRVRKRPTRTAESRQLQMFNTKRSRAPRHQATTAAAHNVLPPCGRLDEETRRIMDSLRVTLNAPLPTRSPFLPSPSPTSTCTLFDEQDGKLECPVCHGRFAPKARTIVRKHNDAEYGGVCKGSGIDLSAA